MRLHTLTTGLTSTRSHARAAWGRLTSLTGRGATAAAMLAASTALLATGQAAKADVSGTSAPVWVDLDLSPVSDVLFSNGAERAAVVDQAASDLAIAAQKLMNEAASYPGRTLVLMPVDAPLTFDSLPRESRDALISLHGSAAGQLYEETMSASLARVMDRVREGRTVRLAVDGLPVEPGRRRLSAARLSNERYRDVIDRVDVFATRRSFVMLGSAMAEHETVADSMPEATRLQGHRELVYRTNGMWRAMGQIDPGTSVLDAVQLADASGDADLAAMDSAMAAAEAAMWKPRLDAGATAGSDSNAGAAPADFGARDTMSPSRGGPAAAPVGGGSNGGGGGAPANPFVDCNANGMHDLDEIEAGIAKDCDGNGIPDECVIPDDTDGDGWLDCADGCPNDPNKHLPGNCGCGVAESPDCDPDTSYGSWANVPSEYTLGSGEGLLFTLGGGAPDGAHVLFQVWSNTSQSVEAVFLDHSAPFVYPGSSLSGVTPGAGEVQAIVRDEVDNILDVVGASIMFVVPAADCNGNGQSDEQDIADGISQDCDGNGIPDECLPPTDSDGDGVGDCVDGCPFDPHKVDPGACGCGVSDVDSDGDLMPDCLDGCPNDPNKIAPGDCGCGESDADSDGDGVADCLDGCPDDPDKTEAGPCGCGEADGDDDGDGVLNCNDPCPDDPCGCNECPTDAGWTVHTPSADTQIVYVSASGGNDGTGEIYNASDVEVGADPFSPTGSIKPFRTIAGASSKLRQGKPDWMLLKRGDTWTNEAFGHWKKSGKSASEKMLIGAYGSASARPYVRTGSGSGLYTQGGGGSPATINNLAIVGVRMHAHTYSGTGQAVGIRHLRGGTDWLIEDCMIEGYATNIVLHAFDGPITNVAVRRCVVVDAYAKDAHSQGIYAGGVIGLLIEDSIFDHNGWNPGVSGAEKTVFNHNMYIGIPTKDVTIRNNIVTRASSHGIQQRPAGVCNDNLCVQNALGVQLGTGGNEGGGANPPWPLNGEVIGNVILDGTRIGSAGGGGKGIALIWCNDGADVQDNIIARQGDGLDRTAIYLSEEGPAGNHDILIDGNVVYDWGKPLVMEGPAPAELSDVTLIDNQFQEPTGAGFLVAHADNHVAHVTSSGNKFFRGTGDSQAYQIVSSEYTLSGWKSQVNDTTSANAAVTYTDPNRGPASYNAFLGGPGTLDAFLAEARQQSRMNWRESYTATAVNNYIRAGFGLDPR